LKKAVSRSTLMTGNSVLLDTNIISGLIKGDLSIADKLDQSENACIPVIAIGELYYGAEYSAHITKNLNNVRKIIEQYTILFIDNSTAAVYGAIKGELRRRGTPIPENDIWIAAIAKQHQLNLVTRDKHFSHVENLAILNW
jgi:tRNA(fMet)-specific endonuclease VapC